MPRRSIWKSSFVDTFLFRIKKNRESLDGFKFPIFPNYIFCIFIGFLVLFWVSYVGAYGIMFPNKDPKDLPNPLQVAAQLSCFFFLFKYKRGDVRQRHLCLLILFFCMQGSLYLQGIPVAFLFGFFILYSINICFFPLDQSEKAFFVLLCGYCIDPHLSRWGFYLVFEQLCYFFLSFFLEKEQQPCALVRLFSFIILLPIQLFFGFFYYQDFYLMEPLRLASLLSGACIVFLSIKRRAMWELIVSFFLYLLVASIIAIVVSPKSPTTLLGVPSGIFIFGLIHFWFVIFLFCIFLKEGSLKGKQPLIPLFFSVVFYILLHLPEVDWLERWIEGADLLLLILAIFAVIENGKENGKTPVRREGSCVAAGIEDEDSGKGGS